MRKTVKRQPVAQVSAQPDDNTNASSDGVGAHGEQEIETMVDPAGLRIIGRLTPEQYWEWRTTSTELQLAARELDVATAQATILAKELEIARLRLALHGSTAMTKAKSKKAEADEEYRAFRERLESGLGFSLADKVIDETFAVKELDAVESNKASPKP